MARLNLEQDIRPLSEFRADAAGMIERVRQTRRPLVLTQRGHSSAVLLSVAEYEGLMEEVELLRDVHLALEQLKKGEGIPQEEAKRLALAKLAP